MKKFFLFCIRHSIATIGFVLFATTSSTVLNAQDNCNGWIAYCCKCTKCLVVDPPPAWGTCRNCTLLCPACRKELGDLDKAKDNLNNKNKVLLERMKTYQSEANRYNSQLTDALVDTYGQESGHWTVSDPSTWRNLTMSGYKSSFGKFTVAAGNVATSFGGGLGAGLLFNTLSTVQSSDFLELEGNISQSVISILTDEGIVEVYTSEAQAYIAARKLAEAIQKNLPLEPAINRFNREVKWLTDLKHLDGISKAANTISIAANLYGLVTAGADLITNLTDIYDNYKARERSEAERKKLQEEIEKNVRLLECIKETQDSINSGGLGFRSIRGINGYALNMLVGFVFSKKLNTGSYSWMYTQDAPYWHVDTFRIKSAIVQLKKQDAILRTMFKDFFEKLIPPLIPWILKQQDKLTNPTQVKLLQMAKRHLGKLMSDEKQVQFYCESIFQDLGATVMSYEIALASDPGFMEIGEDDIETFKSSIKADSLSAFERWTSHSNEKIKAGMGRVNMNFPRDVEWVLEFFKGDNYIGSRSANDRQNYYETAPGSYLIELNNVPVGTVEVEKGKEIKFKYGFLDIRSRGHWWLYDKSKEKFYISDNKPEKLALPPGNYLLQFEEKPRHIRYYPVTIIPGRSVKFELPDPFLKDLE